MYSTEHSYSLLWISDDRIFLSQALQLYNSNKAFKYFCTNTLDTFSGWTGFVIFNEMIPWCAYLAHLVKICIHLQLSVCEKACALFRNHARIYDIINMSMDRILSKCLMPFTSEHQFSVCSWLLCSRRWISLRALSHFIRC